MRAISVLKEPMTREKDITVKIKSSIYEGVKKRDYEVKSFVNDLVREELRRLELLEQIKPYLSRVYASGNSIYVKDDKLNKVVEVVLHEKKLRCLYDETDYCVHVTYAYNELGKLN